MHLAKLDPHPFRTYSLCGIDPFGKGAYYVNSLDTISRWVFDNTEGLCDQCLLIFLAEVSNAQENSQEEAKPSS